MNGQLSFDDVRNMVRADAEETSVGAAVVALSTVEANRILILRLLTQHPYPLTQFCPFVLMGFRQEYKQTAIGPRFKRLLSEGLIARVANRQPVVGAESNKLVFAYEITAAGISYLREHWKEAS